MVGRMLQLKFTENDSILFSSLLDLCDSEMISVGDIEIICGDGQTVFLHKIVFIFAYPHLAEILPSDGSKVVLLIPECNSENVISARNTLYLDGFRKPLQTILEEGSTTTKMEDIEIHDNNIDENVDANSDRSSDELDDIYKCNDENLRKIEIDEELKDENKNSKQSVRTALRLYNSTMDSLNKKETYKSWKHLEETPEEDLIENLCMFLKSVVKPDGSLYSYSSLKVLLNSLARYLRHRKLDIKRDRRFKSVSRTLKARYQLQGKSFDYERDYSDLKEEENKIAENTRRSMETALKLYNITMNSLNIQYPSKFWKHLQETPEEEVVENLCMFLKVVKKPDGTDYNSSSLVTFLRSLTTFLNSTFNKDIRRENRFKKVAEALKAKCRDLHKIGKVLGINGSTPLREEDLRQALVKGSIGKNDPVSLLTLIQYNLSSVVKPTEMFDILNGDFEYGSLSENEVPAYITYTPRRFNKKKIQKRIFFDPENPELCPVRNILFYMSKKTQEQSKPDQPFFLAVNSGAYQDLEKNTWYLDQPIRKSFLSMLKNALIKAGVNLAGQKITAKSAWISQNSEEWSKTHIKKKHILYKHYYK